MQITFLGTSSMVPTKERNHSSIYLKFKEHGFLFDCGEGTQRQIKIAGIKPSNINYLIISHWHGDHVLGIPGLLQTMAHGGYDKKLKVFGPKGTEEFMKRTTSFFSTESSLEYNVKELDDEETFLDNKEFSIIAYKLKHGIECLGYKFIEKDRRRINKKFLESKGVTDGPHLKKLQEGKNIIWNKEKINAEDATYKVKGKNIGFIFDTRVCQNCNKIAENSDLLISESTFSDEHEEHSRQYRHLTARKAAKIAKESNSKKIILTHFSQRYKNANQILKEAKTEFEDVIIAEDFMKITL